MNTISTTTGQAELFPMETGFTPRAITPATGAASEHAEAVRLFRIMLSVINARLELCADEEERRQAATFDYDELHEIFVENSLFIWRAPSGDWGPRRPRTNSIIGLIVSQWSDRRIELPSGEQFRFNISGPGRGRRYTLNPEEWAFEPDNKTEMQKLLAVLVASARLLRPAPGVRRVRGEFTFDQVRAACRSCGAFEKHATGGHRADSTLGRLLAGKLSGKDHRMHDGLLVFFSHRGTFGRPRRYIVEFPAE